MQPPKFNQPPKSSRPPLPEQPAKDPTPPKFEQDKLEPKKEAQKAHSSNRNAILIGGALLLVLVVGLLFVFDPFKKNTSSVNQESQLANSVLDSYNSDNAESSSQNSLEEESPVEVYSSKLEDSQEESEAVESEPKEEGITAETYSGADQLSDDVEGYQYGDYINVYRLNERADPSTNQEARSLIQIGNTLQIVSLQSSGNRVWGELSNGSWVCLKQDNVIYAYGPGIYQTLQNIPIYSAVSSSTQEGQLESGWRIYITGVQWVGNSVWGILEDGKAIVLDTDQKSFVTH